MVVWGRMCGLNMTCLWPDFGLILDGLGAGSKVVLCPSGGMLLWPMITTYVDCFVASLMPQKVVRTKSSLLAFN